MADDYQTATNPKTGEKLISIGGQWKPLEASATHPETGAKAYKVAGQWLTAPKSRADQVQDFENRNPIRRAEDRFSEAVGEPALQMATGAAGAVAGGVRGIYDLATGRGLNQAVADVESTEQSMTRQPRTATGKRAAEIANVPFTLLARGAERAGQAVSSATGSPLAGAATDVAVQAAPAILARAGGSALARTARVPPAAAAEGLTATGAPRAAPSQVGEADVAPPGAPRETPAAQPMAGATTAQPPETAPGAAGAAQPSTGSPGATPDPIAARAQAYARNIGLDWGRLGVGTRKALTTIAEDATALDRLNPEAVKRQAHLEALRVPIRATRGQLERDPVQLRQEALASNTSEGQPIRDVDVAANRDLQANLEVLRGRLAGRRGSYAEPVTEQGEEQAGAVRSPTKTPNQVGSAVQDAVREKAKWSKKGYQALYKAARETEPEARAPLDAVQNLLQSNPEIQHLGWVQGWLSKARSVLPKNEAGETPELTEATLAELHDLRSKAGDIARTGGKEGYYAGQVVKAVDEAMEHVPQGAAAWKRANEAFKTHQQEFANQGLVSKLANQKKGMADRQLTLEKTWQQIATGSLEQIRQVKQTLLKGANPELRKRGATAWRDLRAETVNRILEDARNVTGADETERNILTEAALRRSLKRIPRENLEELIGKGATRELMDIVRARRITTRSPVGGRTTQSGTVPNALVLAERILKHVPGAKYVIGAKHALTQLGERGAAAKAARESTVSPLEQSVRDVEAGRVKPSTARRRAQYQAIEQMGPTIGDLQGPP